VSWNNPFEHRDNRQRMADLVDQPGYAAPLPFVEPELPPTPLPLVEPELPAASPLSRLLQGPFVMEGDLCDVMPGPEAVVLVSPRGEKILLQTEGRVTFHVPAGWRIVVGSKPLRSEGMVKRLVRVGDSVEEVEGRQSMLCLENIPNLYKEAEMVGLPPRR
jgi:hypothetical protein